MPDLVLRFGEGTGRPGESLRLTGERFTFGRAHDNDVCLGAGAVSRQHLEIAFEDGFWRARDMGSHNGVYLDGERVEETEIGVGDELRLGKIGPQFLIAGLIPEPRVISGESELPTCALIGGVQPGDDSLETGPALKPASMAPASAPPSAPPITVQPARPQSDHPVSAITEFDAVSEAARTFETLPDRVDSAPPRRRFWGPFLLGVLVGALTLFIALEQALLAEWWQAFTGM